MTDMTAVHDVSDTPSEHTPSPIEAVDAVSARRLARETAAILRAVADDGHSFAVEHFGRVIGFLVPREGRAPVRRRGKIVYEVPEPQPLHELTDAQKAILTVLHHEGESVADRLIPSGGGWDDTAVALCDLEILQPALIRKSWMGYELTPEGIRHAQELGL